MKLGFGLTQEQSQKLVMTPELKLAIKILQFSAVELSEYIEQQLVENPVLEVAEDSTETDQVLGEATAVEQTEGEKFDIDWEQYFDDIGEARGQAERGMAHEPVRYDSFIAEVPTLNDHLLFQLALGKLSEAEKKVGEFLIGNIDANGYLQCSADEAAIQGSVPFQLAEKMVGVIQGFDPAGVGARDLRECLMIQYEQLAMNDDLLKTIINDHLQEVAEGRTMKVAKKLGVSLHEMQEAIDHLKVLEPKPGRKFSHNDSARYIIPDVVVEKVDGEYIILVNDTSAPRLAVNPVYRNMARQSSGDQESRKYLDTKLNAAVWLMRSIEQRRLTLYKVARCIVDFQREFFNQGIKFLRPMNLKNVAETVGVHESTVSRATSNKYMQTPRGLFEMKFFFTGGLPGTDGTTSSAEAVRREIRDLIEGEDAYKPLSDQKIADVLKSRGIDISRRTVAKYRDEMGIQAASHRRRY